MPKKIINIFISSFLILFSFFYTNKIIVFFKEKDPIMIEIKTYENIDVEKSYQIMKHAGRFDKNLLVFQETNEENRINYKSYITSLNKKKDEVGIVFVLKNKDNILSILNILDKKNIKATFFLSKEIFDTSIELVKMIINNGHEIELLSSSYSVYEVNKYNSIIKFISKEKLNFCINLERKNDLLKSCETSKLYTVTAFNSSNPYLYVKNNLKNGLILLLDNQNKIVKELSITINYILQKGKKIVLLKSIID